MLLLFDKREETENTVWNEIRPLLGPIYSPQGWLIKIWPRRSRIGAKTLHMLAEGSYILRSLRLGTGDGGTWPIAEVQATGVLKDGE